MITPYLSFSGDCRSALELYDRAFSSKTKQIQLYDDYIPEGVIEPPVNLSSWILHAEMNICGTLCWFADEIAETLQDGNRVKLTVQVSSKHEAQKIFDVLSTEAHLTLPPTETFYSTFHAGLVDKFGISWNIVAAEQPNQA